MQVLLEEPYIGVDCEWKPSFFGFSRPSIFQISGKKAVFLIDFLVNDQAYQYQLDQMLTQIVSNPNTSIVGYSFKSDISTIKRGSSFKFTDFIKNLLDVDKLHKKIKQSKQDLGLAVVVEKTLEKRLCKAEQISNWEKRPLRQSQYHYAALDAYVLVLLIEKLLETHSELVYEQMK